MASKTGTFKLTMGPTSTLNFAKSRANNLQDGRTNRQAASKGTQEIYSTQMSANETALLDEEGFSRMVTATEG